MDDVEITDVDDDSPFRVEKPIRNPDLTSVSLTAREILSQYGWYMLIVTVLVYLLVQYLSKRRSSQSNNGTAPEILQDAVLVARRQEAMEAARLRMQEELNVVECGVLWCKRSPANSNASTLLGEVSKTVVLYGIFQGKRQSTKVFV